MWESCTAECYFSPLYQWPLSLCISLLPRLTHSSRKKLLSPSGEDPRKGSLVLVLSVSPCVTDGWKGRVWCNNKSISGEVRGGRARVGWNTVSRYPEMNWRTLCVRPFLCSSSSAVTFICLPPTVPFLPSFPCFISPSLPSVFGFHLHTSLLPCTESQQAC